MKKRIFVASIILCMMFTLLNICLQKEIYAEETDNRVWLLKYIKDGLSGTGTKIP